MDSNQALELADRLIYTQTGKHLTDLEREIFLGSWQGLTYEKIYPLNPEYVEKDVGYKLWKKLSSTLEEKVTKKNLKGALERFYQKSIQAALEPTRIFISYRIQEPDCNLAQQFHATLNAAGYITFLATEKMQLAADWPTQIKTELKQCDYFLLLLSPETAVSEVVIEQLRLAQELRDYRQNRKPVVLPIRVCYPLEVPLNYDLRHYLCGIQQHEWQSPADTAGLLQAILSVIAGQATWGGVCEEGGLAEAESPATFQPLLPTPQPVAEPELPTGQVRLDSAFYIERVPYEPLCYKEVLQPGALIRIKAPRQMGKTSLMARILSQAREHHCRTVPLSFQHADASVFTNLNQLLRWFCARISRKLRLPDQVDQYWSDTYGSKDNCTAYFEDCLLSDTESPLVLGLDEVDRVFQYSHIADDFFGLLRAWYEEAGYGGSDSDRWENLRLVVVHSTEVYVPLDVNQSPFNVGLPIELPEFSPEQVEDLTQRHGLNWQTTQIEQLMALVGGHPYLIRLALYHIAQQQITLEQLLEVAPTEAGLYDDHLRRHLWNLQQHPELGAAFSKVVTTNAPVELPSVQAFKLHSMGLVQMQGNQVIPRFNLYRQYFRNSLKVDHGAQTP